MTPAVEYSHALLTAATPGDLAAAAVALAGGVAPGLALGVAFARRARLGSGAAAVVAVAVTLCLTAVVSVLGAAAGLGLRAGVVVAAALAVALTAAGLWWGRGAPRLRVDGWAWLIAAAAAAAALVQRPWFKISADTFYHVAAARSLIVRDALVVTDPFHGTASGVADPSSGILHTWMAALSHASGMDMAQLFSGVTILGAVVMALGFHALARAVSGSDRVAALVTVAYLIAGQFADFRAVGYPNRFSIGLVWLALALAAELAERQSWGRGVMLVAAAASVCAMHVGNAEFCLLMLGAAAAGAWVLAVWQRVRDGRGEWRPALALTAALLCATAAAAPFVLPRLGVVGGSTIVSGSPLSRPELLAVGPWVVARVSRFFDGGAFAFGSTVVLAVLAGGWALVRRDRTAAVACALLSVPVVMLAVPPVTTFMVRWSFYNLERLAALMGGLVFVGVAYALGRPHDDGGRPQARFIGVAALALSAVLAVPYLQTTFTEEVGAVRRGMNVSVWRSRAGDLREFWGTDTLARYRREFGDRHPVVAAHPETGYYLAAFTSIRVPAAPRSHSPLAIEVASGPRRRDDMRRLLRATATVAERRAILDRWDADYVVCWKSRLPERAAWRSMVAQPELFEVADVSRRLVLFRVRR